MFLNYGDLSQSITMTLKYKSANYTLLIHMKSVYTYIQLDSHTVDVTFGSSPSFLRCDTKTDFHACWQLTAAMRSDLFICKQSKSHHFVPLSLQTLAISSNAPSNVDCFSKLVDLKKKRVTPERG